MIVAAILVLLAIAAWSSGRVPEHLVALALFTLAMIFSVAPASVVFSGFVSSALWLIFGGQVMAVAIRHTGLAQRIAAGAARWIGARSYSVVIGGVVALGVVAGFFLPSALGRVVLLVPIGVALAESYGFAAGSNGRLGILLAVIFGTTLPSLAVLPANVPNAVLAGLAEAQHQVMLGYLEYLVLHFPVLGALRAALIFLLIVRFYPDRIEARRESAPAPPPFTKAERAVAVIAGLTLVLWSTDFLHHLSPAWVSLAAALVLLWPGASLVPPKAFSEQINYASLFFVAGILAVGAIIAHTGLSELLGKGARAILPFSPGADALNFAALTALGSLISLFTTGPAAPTVFTPLAAELAVATGLPTKTVLMSEVVGFANCIFPYQSPPLVVGIQLAAIPYRAAVKLSLLVAAATMLVLLPLDYLWWRALGLIG